MKLLLAKIWRALPIPRSLQIVVMKIMNDQFLVGVTGVIFNDKNEVLLLKHTYRDVQWSLPGGYLQANEHPRQGLEREIYEETRFKIKVVRFVRSLHDANGSRLDMCYWGVFKGGTFRPNEEVVKYGFFALGKLPKLIDNQYAEIARAAALKKRSDRDRVWRSIWRWPVSLAARIGRRGRDISR
jgi:ADP-ribose pyrophosphatase YjhB (NUDIX family)